MQINGINQRTFIPITFSFTLYLRLFVVAGVIWILEVISFLIAPTSNFFLVIDICNSLQGVFIFILFILRPRVLRLIRYRQVNLPRPIQKFKMLNEIFFFRWHFLCGRSKMNGYAVRTGHILPQ